MTHFDQFTPLSGDKADASQFVSSRQLSRNHELTRTSVTWVWRQGPTGAWPAKPRRPPVGGLLAHRDRRLREWHHTQLQEDML